MRLLFRSTSSRFASFTDGGFCIPSIQRTNWYTVRMSHSRELSRKWPVQDHATDKNTDSIASKSRVTWMTLTFLLLENMGPQHFLWSYIIHIIFEMINMVCVNSDIWFLWSIVGKKVRDNDEKLLMFLRLLKIKKCSSSFFFWNNPSYEM